MKKLIAHFTVLFTLLAASLAHANDKTILVAENNYQWSFKVVDCPIDPNKRVILLRKPTLPKNTVLVRQSGKTYRCNVVQIKIDVA